MSAKRGREVRAEHAARPVAARQARDSRNGSKQIEFAFVERFAPTPKVLEARAAAEAAGQAPVAQPGMLWCEMKGTVTLQEAAQDLGVGETTIREHLESGELEAFRSGAGTVRNHARIISKSVVEFINRRKL